MASRDPKLLTPETFERWQQVDRVYTEAGLDLLTYCTLRSLDEQNRLYRGSRSWKQIKVKMQKFRNRGFGFLADAMERIGPCSGKHRTNAAGGEGLHSYGLAFDSAPIVDGKVAWSYKAAKEHWDAYGEAVRLSGLTWGGDWTRFKDRPHAQLGKGGNPLKIYTPDQVHEMLTATKQL